MRKAPRPATFAGFSPFSFLALNAAAALFEPRRAMRNKAVAVLIMIVTIALIGIIIFLIVTK